MKFVNPPPMLPPVHDDAPTVTARFPVVRSILALLVSVALKVIVSFGPGTVFVDQFAAALASPPAGPAQTQLAGVTRSSIRSTRSQAGCSVSGYELGA